MHENEQILCDAMITLLERKFGAPRTDVIYPERDHSGPPVDVRFRIAERSFAIEHTLIEPFPKAIRTSVEFGKFSAGIESELNGSMPKPGTYVLTFPVHPTRNRSTAAQEALRSKVIDWVRAAGSQLHAQCPQRLDRHSMPSDYNGVLCTRIDEVTITLSRRVSWAESGRHDGALFVSRAVGENLEDLRRSRLEIALEKKLPKLLQCEEEGATTILILEYSDVVLTNQIVVAQALEGALAARTDWPTHVYLADTSLEEAWSFFHPVADKVYSIDMPYIDVPGRPSLLPPTAAP